MKKLYFFTITIATVAFSQAQTTIALWDFNGASATTVLGGELTPSVAQGAGAASLVGGVTATFASGTASGGSSDPVTTTPNNYGWNGTTWAAAGTENKQRGYQFQISTTDYADITFKFDQRLSNTAANTWVVQYSVDGAVWTDAQTFTFTPAASGTGDVWYNNRTVDLTAVSDIENQETVYVRVVAAFDPVANNYVASKSTSTYSSGSTSRLDMVTITAATSLSIQNFTNEIFKMYPNPSTDYINFSDYVSIIIFDVTGKIVKSAKNTTKCNVSDLDAGIYFVNINGVEIKKLIVK